jgi:O-antigen ligase
LRLGSRGIFIAVVVATAWLFLKNSHNSRQVLINAIVAIFLMLIIFNLPGLDLMAARFRGKDISTLSGRLPLISSSFEYLKSLSFIEVLIGGGASAGAEALGKIFHAKYISPHNQYLETLMDYGLLGLASMLWLMITGFRQSLKMHGYSSDIRTGIIVFMLVGFISLTPLRYVLPWIAFGYILSTPAESEKKRA